MRKRGIHKKLTSILIAAAMVVTCVPVSAAAPGNLPEGVVLEEAEEVEAVKAPVVEETVTKAEEEGAAEADGTEGSTQESDVAKIGETSYGSLQEAVDASKENAVIVLQENIDIAEAGLTISADKEVTLDLNGCEVKAANTDQGSIKVLGSLTLEDKKGQGKIYTETDYTGNTTGYGLIRAEQGGDFIMNSGLIEAVRENPSSNGQFAVTVEDTGSSVVINNGKIEAGWYAIAGNGNDLGGTSITVDGGELISTADYAIYHPQAGTLTINKGVVYGAAGGVSMNRGNLEVNGGTITSKGTGDTGEWGDGTGGMDNAAITLKATYGNVDAKINGGLIVAEGNAVAIDSSAQNEVGFAIAGGEFTFKDEEAEQFAKYLVNGFSFKKNAEGKYGVVEDQVAQIGDKTYSTLQKAIDAAKEKDTIKILSDIVSRITFIVPAGKNICLDLNGHVIEITTEKANAFAVDGILEVKDSTAPKTPEVDENYSVTYESGAIKGYSAILVRRGGKVTITSGTVNGTKNLGIGIEGNRGAESADRLPVDSAVTVNGGYVQGQEFAIAVFGLGAKALVNNGVVLSRDNAAISGNGTKEDHRWDGGTEIVINGGTVIGHIKTSGFIACGIYHPQAGNLRINGGDIYAENGVGVLMRGGNMEMTGGNITTTGNISGKVGDSTVIEGCYGVLIDGKSKYPDLENTHVTITGGNISTDKEVESLNVVETESSRMQVSGGIYRGKVEESVEQYLLPGCELLEIEADTYEVVKKSFEEKDAIETVTAVVKDAEGKVVASEDVAVTITDNELKVTGKITATHQVELTYQSVYGETNADPIIIIKKNSEDGFDISSEEIILSKGNVIYAINVSGLEILPEHTILEVEAPKVDSKDAVGESKKITALSEALQKENAVNVRGLAASASSKINEKDGTVTTESKETFNSTDAKDALDKEQISTNNEDVSLVVSSYLDIQIKKIGTSEDNKNTVTLDIKPMYVVKATTAKNSEDISEDGVYKNTVAITEPQELTVNETVTITISVPETVFASSENIFVEHKADAGTYYYTTQVKEGSLEHKVTFVNPHGFSEFILKQDGRTGVINFKEIGSKKYNLSNLEENFPVPAVPSGQYFIGWEITGNIYTTLTNDLLTEIAKENRVEATPKFGSNSSGGGGGTTTPSYTITTPAETEGGKVIASVNSANQGDTVTLTVEAKEGYELDELIVTDARGAKIELTESSDGKFTFQMPGSNVEIKATFKVEGQQKQEIVILKAQARDLADRTLNDKDTKVKFAKGKAPKTDVIYESSNDKVVAVNEEGHIHYTGLGEAVITVKAAETEEYKAAEVSVTVKVGLKQPTFTPSARDNGFAVTSSTVKGAEKFQVQYVLKGRSFKNESAKSKTFTVDNKLRKGKVSAANKKTYRIRVRAINGDVKSKWSPVKTITTK